MNWIRSSYNHSWLSKTRFKFYYRSNLIVCIIALYGGLYGNYYLTTIYMFRENKRYKILDLASANGVGNTIYVWDFKNITVLIASTGSANAVVKCKGAISLSPDGSTYPNFANATSITNPYDTIQMISLSDATTVNGAVWVVFSGTDKVQLYSVNTSNIDWLTFDISNYLAGQISVYLLVTNNA